MNIENQHVGEIFRALGSRHQQTLLQSTDTPFMYRSTWSCGCVVDYIDAGVGPCAWMRCADHRDHGEKGSRRAGFPRSDRVASPPR
jgi:hypothetical protein